MMGVSLGRGDGPLRLLLLGAHADDIEIGCGGTLLELLRRHRPVTVDWCVLSGTPARAAEARASAAVFLAGAAESRTTVMDFPDGHFPYHGGAIKAWFETLKERTRPDLILTHRRHDRHQDHREVANLTWNTFRDHLILEYEVPKYDGDLDPPNLYVPLDAAVLERKIALVLEGFPSQRAKPWFDADTFKGLARLRGVECAAPSRFAEAFHASKMVLT